MATKRSVLMGIATTVLAPIPVGDNPLETIVSRLKKQARKFPASKHYSSYRGQLRSTVRQLESMTPNNVFKPHGNSKLPFFAFSTMPLFTCPGAGKCKKWCYSLRAWRFPAAFFRQLKNTILMRHFPEVIAREFSKIPQNSKIRLYVDGDFETPAQVGFWFNLIRSRPDLSVFGYSKSWDEIHCQAEFPPNYVLNISGGGKPRNVSKLQMLALPISRGEFIALPLIATKERSQKRFALPEYHSEVRAVGTELTGERVFSCPGKCGSCAGGQAACSSAKFDGITIAIGIH